MAATRFDTAPIGTVCCFLCHRYLDPDKLDDGRCSDRDGCQRAAVRLIGRPAKLSKRARRALGMP